MKDPTDTEMHSIRDAFQRGAEGVSASVDNPWVRELPADRVRALRAAHARACKIAEQIRTILEGSDL